LYSTSIQSMIVPTSTPTGSISTLVFNTIDFYEEQIRIEETCASHYWNLGIAYLLAGREDDAQLAWFTPLSATTEIDDLTNDLILVLEKTAMDLAQVENLEQVWLIRQHIRILAPERLENILESIVLSNSLGNLTSKDLIEWQVSDLLSRRDVIDPIDENLLRQCLRALIEIKTDESLKIIRYCLQLAGEENKQLTSKLVVTSFNLLHQTNAAEFATKLAEICNDICPNSLDTLCILSGFYSLQGIYDKSIDMANQYYQLAPTIVERLFGSYLIQSAYFSAGNWEGANARVNPHRDLLAELIRLSPQNLHNGETQRLVVSSFFLPYIEDNPRTNKVLQNELAAIYQQNVGKITIESEFEKTSVQKKTSCLRIGYIASTFKVHSVAWLNRWLIHHHNRESFQIFIYCLTINKEDDFNHKWFRNKVDVSYYCNGHPQETAAQIRADEIDILIDLDSLTYDMTAFIMAYKPAPVQISWLGWDSSGIPAIDYFIADPYVLPDDAQDYYQEKIWRLPQTYLAVDGFEIGIQTLRREDLDIPSDAVIYLSSQSGYKRHPDSIRCQMEIIKAVPNSYFLIKGKSDPETIENFFGKLATEVGISLDRLRFLKRDIDEYTHRANLAIADIVLDTFPYNGATTTLETLWMGIPMVTQVGQQFAARNSYTFMLNAGITEGIAWSEQEYIEWGIRLGLDRELRYTVQNKLREARTTAPVWNAKKFTLEMEQAYRDMWAKYQEQQQHELN
jgi:predicted O-linked N-acetylglucosamine transferase (SPINDLY family)